MVHLAGVRYVPPEGKGGDPFSIPLVLSCDEQPVRRVAFEDLDHVRVTKAFLNNPESFLRRL